MIDTKRKFLITKDTKLLNGSLAVNLSGIIIRRKDALNFLMHGKTENKLPFKVVFECQDLIKANELWLELIQNKG
jgi:hypothetical protein